jgi:hypothetical protein
MSERKIKAPKDDLPAPWEERPISIDRWMRHRETLMKWAHSGHRPREWWAYEKEMRVPSRETIWLFEHDELSEAELSELLPWWREKFDQAQETGFCYNASSERGWLEGAAARRAHCVFWEIPFAVIKQFEAERRQSLKVVKKLKAAAVPPMASP